MRGSLRLWGCRAAWVAVLGMSALIVINTLPYFTLRDNFEFYGEKGTLANEAFWRRCFYAHVAGGMVCLATGPWLFWSALLQRFPGLHRGLGRVYGLAVLGWAGPTGLYLSLHAKGGLAGRSAFLFLTLLWWGATAAGVRAILGRRTMEHRRWMVRSYALALSAVFFRLFQAVLYLTGLDDGTNYVVSLWLSLIASLWIGEAQLRRSGTNSPRPAGKGASS